jgi:anti-anti-sigma factor
MEINTRQSGETWEVAINGRLDGYWSDHLIASLEEVVRGGAHHIRLNMSDVVYISSAGIRVLLIFYKQLSAIQGSFGVSNPSEHVRKVLEMSGLKILLAPIAPVQERSSKTESRQIETENALFEIFDLDPGSLLKCRTIGNPDLFEGCRFEEKDCQTVAFPDSTFGVGVGAFGSDFSDCRGRFGEYLSAAGVAAYMPTDDTNSADYSIATGTLVPEIQVLYGIGCDGSFSHLARFEANKQTRTISLSALLTECISLSKSDAIGIVIAAESAGLMGASLRKSPAMAATAGAPFDHPGVRQWLSFSAERSHINGLALVVGVAAKDTRSDSASKFLRPLNSSGLIGHLHAAAFPYRPLQKGQLDLKTIVASLFESESVRGVLHLLTDDRQISGAGESEFIRGACWFGPIDIMM